MTEISRSSQVVFLLRQELQRMSTRRASKGDGAASTRDSGSSSPIRRLREIASDENYGEEEFNRSLVQALLSERLGSRLTDDARFQRTVDEVLRLINSDEQARTLITAARKQLLA
ncbi:hypothetical protein [Novosphingobium beihaiensis]|uniref:Uncharacterized protein n=1 Tax=Novosphingobium beihaiensis TaxID=2930389 RepID=A0ABT0BQ30_9SPHN|nr:hypothetical protein [Novosphingobium beihaiensis]MCJ2186978.1 hypothetical protein [Novosphingobium beihaiensis]